MVKLSVLEGKNVCGSKFELEKGLFGFVLLDAYYAFNEGYVQY